MDRTQTGRQPREITGFIVLMILIAFFGVVATVNAVMIRLATATFGGVETENAYKAGLAFNRDIAAARAQEARHWQVAGVARRNARGLVDVQIELRDARGAPVGGLIVDARLAHPADARRDHAVVLKEAKPGVYRGETELPPGQWDLIADARRADETLFHSKSRVQLP